MADLGGDLAAAWAELAQVRHTAEKEVAEARREALAMRRERDAEIAARVALEQRVLAAHARTLLSEGQAAKILDVDRVDLREQADARRGVSDAAWERDRFRAYLVALGWEPIRDVTTGREESIYPPVVSSPARDRATIFTEPSHMRGWLQARLDEAERRGAERAARREGDIARILSAVAAGDEFSSLYRTNAKHWLDLEAVIRRERAELAEAAREARDEVAREHAVAEAWRQKHAAALAAVEALGASLAGLRPAAEGQ